MKTVLWNIISFQVILVGCQVLQDNNGATLQCGNNICPFWSTCTNNTLSGEMECGFCMAGFMGNNCTDGDEFTILNYDPCARHGTGTCVNTLGGYNCTCLVGWTGPRCQYLDENVIASDRACLRGFVNKAFNDTYAESQDIDECSTSSTNTCGFHQHCNNTAGSYKCECDIGWEGSNCGKDIDECTRANICGINQHCINTGGSYVCLGDTANSSTTNTVDGGHMHIVHSSAYSKQNPENQQETKLDVVLGSVFGTVALISGF
ncbi:adhesion G protein-coupled receptor E1-like [Dreissena polymorpha]|uniref:adhesion G protein-coupled receptor E1-like n=1 Tax=Dreissena polymorpha TaxID=45954 RepID=UPI00226519ED|nr:adhesion G protein-coupled receptor E1-like [Dreissena polymorpha]